MILRACELTSRQGSGIGTARGWCSFRGPAGASRVIALGILGAWLLFAPSASGKVHNYRVKLTFTQTRPWTYYLQRTSPDCTRTDQGNGLDVAKVSASLPGVAYRGGTGFGMVGKYTRTGAMTHTVAGSQCAPSAVFPSTWRIDTTTAGTVTASEATPGCGPKTPKVSFGTVEFAGSHLVLQWDSAPIPEFAGCPFEEHSNQASPGNTMPGPNYRDVVLKVSRSQLRAGKRLVTATGESTKGATETCGNVTQGCAEGVTYIGTASVHSSATATFTRIGR